MNTAYLAICATAEGLCCFTYGEQFLYTVIGRLEVIIININVPLLEGGLWFFPACFSGEWFLACVAVMEGRCERFVRSLNGRTEGKLVWL